MPSRTPVYLPLDQLKNKFYLTYKKFRKLNCFQCTIGVRYFSRDRTGYRPSCVKYNEPLVDKANSEFLRQYSMQDVFPVEGHYDSYDERTLFAVIEYLSSRCRVPTDRYHRYGVDKSTEFQEAINKYLPFYKAENNKLYKLDDNRILEFNKFFEAPLEKPKELCAEVYVHG